MATGWSHITMLLGLWALMPRQGKSVRRWCLSFPQVSGPPDGQEIRKGDFLQIPRLPFSPVYHPVGSWHCFMMLKPLAGTMFRQS